MSTETLYASQCGYIQSHDAVYATAVAGSNLSVPGGAWVLVGQDTGDFQIWATFIAFDLSAYTPGGTAASPVLSMYLTSGPWNGTHDYNVRDLGWGPTLATADWIAPAASVGTLRAHRSSTGVAAGYNAFTDDAMATAIEAEMGGTLYLWMATATMESNTSDTKNTVWAAATGAPNAPRLVFDYTAPVGGGGAPARFFGGGFF